VLAITLKREPDLTVELPSDAIQDALIEAGVGTQFERA
jgi:hypothetical protein